MSQFSVLCVDMQVVATQATEAASVLRKEAVKNKFDCQHMFASTPTADQIEKRIVQWTTKLKKMEVDFRDKEQNKEVRSEAACGNYLPSLLQHLRSGGCFCFAAVARY